LERAVSQDPGEDPIFAALMHSFERHLSGQPVESVVDGAVAEGLHEHPRLRSEHLKEWVRLWHEIPDDVKERVVPAELRSLSVETPLDDDTFQRVCARSYRRPPTLLAPVTWRFRPIIGLPPIVSLGEPAKITGTVPGGIDGEPVAQLGAGFTLRGSGFSTKSEDNLVVIYRLSAGGDPETAITSHPTASSPTSLQCTAPLPNSTKPGRHKIQVSVTGRQPSNVLDIWLTQPLGAPASILSISPAAQYPGRRILITVKGFGTAPSVWWRAASAHPQDLALFSEQVKQLGPTQIEAEVPASLVRSPGQYWIAVGGANQALSGWAPVNVLNYRYKVTFNAITCLDESDPEWWGDDEIVTQWVVVADQHSWHKGTGEYGGFEDGTTKPYRTGDRDVFLPGAGPGEVRADLSLGTALFEWDAGDAADWNAALTGVADIVGKIPVYGQIVSGILKVIGKLISLFGGDPDHLGTKVETWTADELFALTGTSGSASRSLQFLNDDDTGSYRLTYDLQRVPA
jgi:hypothetical protein